MKKECEIVRDLLPLYAEGMTSEASNEMIEEHLKSCPECSEILTQMKETIPADELPAENELPLKALAKTYHKKNRSLAVLIAAIAASVLISVYAWLSAPRYLKYEEAVSRTEETETGVRVYFTDAVHHIRVQSYMGPDEGLMNTDLECWTSTLDQLWHAETQSDVLLEGDLVWFRDNHRKVNGQSDVLMHGKYDIPSFTLRRLTLNYYFYMAAGMTLILGICFAVIRNRKISDIISQISMVFLAWCLASVIVERGIGAATWSLSRDFSLICMLCVSLSIVMICLFRRRREKKSTRIEE